MAAAAEGGALHTALWYGAWAAPRALPPRTPPPPLWPTKQPRPQPVQRACALARELPPGRSLIKEQSFPLLRNPTWSHSIGANDTGQQDPYWAPSLEREGHTVSLLELVSRWVWEVRRWSSRFAIHSLPMGPLWNRCVNTLMTSLTNKLNVF